MNRLFVTVYEYRDDLKEDDYRALTKAFAELGTTPAVIAHYERLDGRGGFMIEGAPEDPEQSFELTLRYGRWVRMQVFPVTTMADAFPVFQKLYG